MIDDIISSALVLSVPIALAALGGAIHRRAGIVNIGLEAHMLIGAFIGALVSGATQNWVLGVLGGAAAGALSGWLMSAIITRLKANEIIAGLGFNIVVLGLVGYVLRSVFSVSGTLHVPGLQRLPTITIPGLDDIPVVGAALSGKDPLFWLTIALILLIAWALARTPGGLRLRASGAAVGISSSLGLRTLRIRDVAGVIAGALAGLGGVALSLGAVGLFNENMTAGRGFVALAAFYFGRSRPLPTALACVLFGFFDALQIRLQTVGGLSPDLISTLPYVAVVLVLTLTAIREQRRNARRLV